MSITCQEMRTPRGASRPVSDDEPQESAIDADVIADGGRGDPGEVLLELEGVSGRAVVEAEGKMEGEEEGESVATSAPHCWMRSRSGKSASRMAPASGVKVMIVKIEWSIFIVSLVQKQILRDDNQN